MLRALLRLSVLAFLAGAVLWVILPPLAGSVVGAAAVGFGLHGEQTQATVSASPPLKLLLLQADSIRIRSRQATWRTLSADAVDLTLTTVRLGEPSGSIDGRLDDVELPDGAGSSVHVQTVRLSGSAQTPDVVAELSQGDVQAAVRRVLPAELGGLAAAITLAPPDGLRIRAAGRELGARVAVGSDGSLTFSLEEPGLPDVPITIMHPDPGIPFVLRSVRESDNALELSGTLDARGWGL